jgi:hypothetical protein
VKEFNCILGETVSENGRVDGDIDRRVNARRKVVGSMTGLARSEVLSTKAKLAVYNSVLLPTLMYGSESWVCQAQHKSKLNAVCMSFLQNMCGKTRPNKVRNTWVRNECGVKESIINKYENVVLGWFGHVERMGDERIAKQVMNGSVEGVRRRGRMKDPWLRVVDKCLKSKKIRSIKCKRKCQKSIMSVKEVSGVCKDRVKWRAICGWKQNKGK